MRIESAIQKDDPDRYVKVLSKMVQESTEKKDEKEGESKVKCRRIEGDEIVQSTRQGPPVPVIIQVYLMPLPSLRNPRRTGRECMVQALDPSISQ